MRHDDLGALLAAAADDEGRPLQASPAERLELGRRAYRRRRRLRAVAGAAAAGALVAMAAVVLPSLNPGTARTDPASPSIISQPSPSSPVMPNWIWVTGAVVHDGTVTVTGSQVVREAETRAYRQGVQSSQVTLREGASILVFTDATHLKYRSVSTDEFPAQFPANPLPPLFSIDGNPVDAAGLTQEAPS